MSFFIVLFLVWSLGQKPQTDEPVIQVLHFDTREECEEKTPKFEAFMDKQENVGATWASQCLEVKAGEKT